VIGRRHSRHSRCRTRNSVSILIAWSGRLFSYLFIDGLDYVILSDANIEAAIAFGTAFMVDKAYIAKREERGTDIEGSSMRQFGVLPVPAVYMIDRSGTIVFDYVNADYKIRLPADELLAAAGSVATR
jgi:peroxiredoxin